MLKAMLGRLHRDGKSVSEIFKLDPLLLRYYFIKYLPRDLIKDTNLLKVLAIKKIDKEEKAWVLPMLIGQAILTPLIYYQLNLDDSLSVWKYYKSMLVAW